MTRVCVVGLGHVGLPTAALLAEAGHEVVGCDTAPEVVARVNAGHAGLPEPGLDALLAEANPEAFVRPGTPGVLLWAAVADEDGSLLACGAAKPHTPGVPHLSSVAVHPRARRQGLGAAVTVALVRRLLRTEPEDGENSVLVGHLTNLRLLSTASPDEGGTVVFRPDGEGFVLVGSVPPQGWQELAAR